MEFAPKKLNADKVLNILCTILKWSGLWTPFNKAAYVQVLYKAYGTVFQTFFFVVFVTSLVGGVLTVEKINNISSRLPLTVAEVAMVPKLIPVFFSNRALQQIRRNIENIDVLSPSEHILADTHLSFYRQIISLFALFPQMTILGWTISSLLSPERQLIYGAWCPGFDWQNSRTDYWTLQIYQYISSFINAYYNITIDMYYCFAMYMVSVELKLLGERFISMQAIDSFQSSRRLLVNHAKTLNTIRSSIGVVEFCMGWSYVTQVLMSVLCICSLTNELAQNPVTEDPFYFLSSVTGIIAFMFQIGMCCYFGQTVYSAYDTLSTKFYRSNWPHIIQDPGCGRMVVFMMENMKKDCIIYIGKIMPMVLTTFTSILSLAYRLYTVVNKV